MTEEMLKLARKRVEQRVEQLAAEFHAIYQAEAKRQGDVRHKDAYTDLPENIKEFDRVLARHVLVLLTDEIRKAREMALEDAARIADKYPTYRKENRDKGSRVADDIRSLGGTTK